MKKIKKKSPNKSPYPDNSKERKIYEKGWRDCCNAMDAKIEDIEVRGMQKCLKVILYILRSKYKSSDEDLSQLSKDIEEHSGYIKKGRVTLEMIENELINVYDVQF